MLSKALNLTSPLSQVPGPDARVGSFLVVREARRGSTRLMPIVEMEKVCPPGERSIARKCSMRSGPGEAK
jgi:hypothetical protein